MEDGNTTSLLLQVVQVLHLDHIQPHTLDLHTPTQMECLPLQVRGLLTNNPSLFF